MSTASGKEKESKLFGISLYNEEGKERLCSNKVDLRKNLIRQYDNEESSIYKGECSQSSPLSNYKKVNEYSNYSERSKVNLSSVLKKINSRNNY
mmetsp:Transcript_27953/g.26996  ORF Transcript_27953/g.26996 Transcript_27953/m.26996 type:complete len:94 (+) Transcript_27953:260-541(+)